MCFGLTVACFFTNIYAFVFFYSVVVGISAGLITLPILYIIYEDFGEENSGNVTGILLGFFGLFTALFDILNTWIINPDNISANIPYREGKNNTYIFGHDVAKNVPYGILA